MKSLRSSGLIQLKIPSRGGEFESRSRSAEIEVRFAKILIVPENIKNARSYHRFQYYCIYSYERNPPEGESPLEWMLLTSIPVKNFDQAVEKIKWYSYRFRIETLHRILKSGFKAEKCRLGNAESLARYLSFLSVASWRVFWITIIGRVYPEAPCTIFLLDSEWKALYSKIYSNHPLPERPISTRKAIHLIGRLGGFFDRTGDGQPGVVSLWRGWRRLSDLTDGWKLASAA